ncbi:hypothetical protein [Acinetobacter sp. TGL-Y2]|uniref:hypothetical protein n=1 Tax=Acinetobacter sp. TGL-Y2 TaxID=1407071 RepID=UPI002A18E21A|nr:hypothetical protein [Acinetobacter sp. TGL-Y2]
MDQINSRKMFNKEKDSLTYSERFEDLKKVALDTLFLFDQGLSRYEDVYIDVEKVDETKKIIMELENSIKTEIKQVSDYAILSLIDNKLVESSDLLDDYLKLYSEYQAKLESNKIPLVENRKKEILEKIEEFIINLKSIKSVLSSYLILRENYDKVVGGYLQNATTLLENELTSFRKLRNIADNAKTENIYDKAVERYRKLEVDYRTMFYLSIGITLLFSILVFSLKVQLVPIFFTNIEFWAIKISLLAVGVTLITYFLKQSTHYQKLADQNYQTQIELQAYPSFMESIPTDEAASVRKELALKYFGREIDGSVHKDMGNLIADQMKSTTEMVKATTDAIKKLKEF